MQSTVIQQNSRRWFQRRIDVHAVQYGASLKTNVVQRQHAFHDAATNNPPLAIVGTEEGQLDPKRLSSMAEQA